MVDAHIDATLFARNFGGQHDQLAVRLDHAADPIGHAAGRIADMWRAFKDNDIGIWSFAFDLAGGAHAGGITADDDKGGIHFSTFP